MRYLTEHLPETCWKRIPLDPQLILLHYISAKNTRPEDPYNIQHIRDIFEDYRVSAHLLIDRNGDVIELVPLQFQAWHAGRSRLGPLKKLNKYAFGIELVGRWGEDFTKHQYDSLGVQVHALMGIHGISSNKVKGHEQVSGPSVRTDYKTDPGPSLDWIRLGQIIERLS